MYCSACGNDTPAPASHCRACGMPLSAAAHSSVAAVAAMTVEPAVTSAAGAPAQPAAGPLEPGAPFGTRYRILRQLGAGGMGVVYQAWDAELGVAVALKVIRPEITGDPYTARDVERRFKRELLLARQVTHKNVVRIHDLGEIDGIKYLTMPYIEGRDLAHVLLEQGALPVREALRLAKQIAAGLAAAHEAGVVHRDLKPENVMIDADGQAQIMDFGISRSVTPDATGTMTAAGAVVGTLEYMAPEQARGNPADQRADIYAFGLMLHDMIAGRRRLATSESALSEMMSRMQQAPPPLRTLVPAVPEELERIVARCLEPDPAQRYEKTPDLVADLATLDSDGRVVRAPAPTTHRWKAATAVLVLLLVVGGAGAIWLLRARSAPTEATAAAREPVSVLIADFDDRANDPVFEGSLEQALGIAMEGASFITVFPRRDAMRTADQIRPDASMNEDMARLVSRREGIKVVLAGAIAPDGSGYRISVRAIDAVPGRELASATRTAASKAQVLEVVGKLAGDIRTALGDTTTESGKLAADETFTASSLQAAKAYATAQRLAMSNRDEEAIAQYKAATELDPKFGRAYAGWAACAWKLGRIDQARDEYSKAFTLVDRMTERERYRTFGAFYTTVAANYQKAIENFSKLVEKYPADSAAHNNLAVAYFNLLQFKKALDEGRRLTQIYPSSVLYRYNYALYAMYAGDFETATEQARKAIALNPDTPKAYLALAMAALAQGRAADAQRAYGTAMKTGARGASLAAIGLADLAMYQGRMQDAVALLTPAVAQDEASQFTAAAAAKRIALAEAELAQGDTRAALDQVDAAMKLSQASSVLVPAAGLLIDAGRDNDAAAIAKQLSTKLQSHGATYGKLVEAQLALKQGKAAEAVALLDPAQVDDLWLVRFYRGIAYLETGEADAAKLAWDDLDACQKRIGEATAVFLDDSPSFRYTVPLWYWRARVQDAGVGERADALKNYTLFIQHNPPDSRATLVTDARRRTK